MAIGPSGGGRVGVDRRTAHDHRRLHAPTADGVDGGGHGVRLTWGRGHDAHRHHAGCRRGVGERGCRHVGAEVDDAEALARRGPATSETGRPCRSPGAAPSTIVPRRRPRRVKRGARRPSSPRTTAVAWCSSATPASPVSHRRPTISSAGATRSNDTSSGSAPLARVSSMTRPGARLVAGEQPVGQAAGRGGRPGCPPGVGREPHPARPRDRPRRPSAPATRPRPWRRAGARCARTGRRSCSGRPSGRRPPGG